MYLIMQSFQIAVTWFGRKLAWKNEDGSFFVGDWFLWASYISVALQALVTLFKTLIQVPIVSLFELGKINLNPF